MKRSGRKSAAQTPAPAKERVYGSKKNPSGSAASKSSASKIKLSSSIAQTLKDKAAKYNKTHKKDVSTSTLAAVMRRGMGAYSKSHRPTITGGAPNSRQAWGFARVNKFLKKKSGEPVKKAYIQDDDLLENGGQLASKVANDVYISRDKNALPKDAIIVGHRYNDKIKAGSEGLFAADLRDIEDTSYGKNVVFLSIGKDAKVKTISSTYDYLDKIGELEKPNQYLKEKYGYDTYFELNEERGSLDNPNNSYYETQKKALEEMRNRGEDFEVLEMKYEDDANPHQWLITTIKDRNLKFKKGAELPVGRLAKGMTLEDIAKHHKINVAELKKELELGIKTEMEHTYDKEIAKAIAYDHLFENPRYYSDLSELEMEAEARKLEDFYANGGQTGQSCKVVDQQGEALTDRESLEQMTECLENLPQTKSMYFDPQKNDYTPERKKLHRQIIYEFKKDLICVENSQPIAILMGGSPASGKSTFLKKYAPYLLKTEILKIDADEIRAKLPEYQGFNATQTHLETKDIVNTLLSDRNIGIPCLFDVIYDGTMNSTKSYIPLINLLKSLGYKVFIVYIDKVPKEVVVKRSIERYKRSGRFVPLEVIDDFFEKGTEALEKLKNSVDGYMIVDGSSMDYRIIERGGIKLPKNRNYSKIGEPIMVKESEIVRELKRGGELNPDDPKVKNQITHKSGSAGGMLVGRRHSEGGIKAVNKSTGQPLEMEGGEVVITRDAVSDPTLVEFEGKKMTKRQVLSAINESGGGVAFADGGDIPDKCSCSGKQYNYGGKVTKDLDIVNDIMSSHRKLFGITDRDLLPSEAVKKIFKPFHIKMEEGGEVSSEEGMISIVSKKVLSYKAFSQLNNELSQVAMKRAYKDFLKSKFDVDFNNLPQSIQVALLLGNQKLVDNFLNS